MTPTLRLATADDAASILAIYAPVVLHTAISFETEPPTVLAMRQRLEETLAYCPWIVAVAHGEVAGYAYGSKHRARAAYQWSVDVSVYIHPRWHRQGLGRALYNALFPILRLQGFYHAYAGITLPNPASVGLHTAVGFTPVGVYRDVGYKHDAWHDVGWWQLALQPLVPHPTPPTALAALRASPALATLLPA